MDNCEHLPHFSELWVLKPDVSRRNWEMEVLKIYVRIFWHEIDDAVKSFHVFDLSTYGEIAPVDSRIHLALSAAFLDYS